MKNVLRAAMLALIFVCLVAAQAVDRYSVPLKVTLSGSSRTITIVPFSGKRIELDQITAQPSGTASGITLAVERDCSSVTTTSPIARPAVNSQTAPTAGAKFTAYDNTAATGCTPLAPDWIIPDLGLLPIPSQGIYTTGGTGRNMNIRILPASGGTLTGTLRLQIVLSEAR